MLFHNKNLSHYYEKYIYTIRVELDANNFLTIREKGEAKIIRHDESSFDFDFHYFIKKRNAADGTSAVQYNHVQIDGLPQDLTKVVSFAPNAIDLSRKLPITLKGRKTYEMTTDISLIFNIEADYEYFVYSERFIDYLRIQVEHSQNLRVIFIPLGNEVFETPVAGTNYFTKVYRGLLLPERGFRLIFVKI